MVERFEGSSPSKVELSRGGWTPLPGRARGSPRARRRSLADLPADLILLLIERALLGLGDVATVRAGHRTLLVADRAILAMQPRSLAAGDLAFLALLVDALVLVGEAVVHLFAARVFRLPGGVGERCGREAGE